MKHFLCLMGRLSPISSLYKTKLSAMVAVMTLFMCLIAAYKAPAQTGAAVNMDEIKPLQIGDTIPEELWHLPLQVVNHPEGKETITLNDYRGKLIILDFWATWCSSCIADFPKSQALEEKSNDLVVIPITYEHQKKVRDFITSNETIKPIAFTSIVGDSTLSRLFPHRSLPHYIWINKAQQYVSRTDSGPITEYNVRLISKGGIPYWQEKDDFLSAGPLFLSNELPREVQISGFSILIEGKVAGLSSGSGKVYPNQNRDRYYSNLPLLEIYKQVLTRAYPGLAKILDKGIDVRDTTSVLQNKRKLYTFHYVAPLGMEYKMNEMSINALNALSGYTILPPVNDAERWTLVGPSADSNNIN